jgi:LPXTG-motif cell wall-anchored protein
VPWLVYDIIATGFGDTATITFAGSGQTSTVTVPVGNDRVLWPGAAIDAAGVGTDWPGWDLDAGGEWFQNPANEFYWAGQPDVTVTVEVNPTIGPFATPYPPASPECAAAPPEDELPNTGIDSAAIGLLGLLLLLGGGGALVAERTIRSRKQS